MNDPCCRGGVSQFKLFYVCLRVTGEAAAAHLGDTVPDEQGPAAEAGPVPDHGPPHRGAAHRSEAGRRDPLLQL